MTAGILIPPVVYVPCESSTADGLVVDLRTTKDGEIALIVYTALDRLIDCCGQHQPWAVLRTEELERVREETNFELLLFDLDIPEDQRRKAA
jgi:hypothetical protein